MKGVALMSKEFSINKDDREIYAGLIIQEIDNHNFGAFLVEKEEKRDNESSYSLFSMKNESGKDEFFNVSRIVEDCDFFISLVFELFLSFKINMYDISKKYDLQSDYSRFANFDKSALKRYEEKKLDNIKNKNNSNITLNQQIMAIRAMLTKLGVTYEDTNNATLTAFIQFLLKKEVGVPANNSYIYEIIRAKNHKSRKNEKKNNKDCDFVAEQFEKIKLLI